MKKIAEVLTIGICLTVLIIAGFPRLGDATVIYGCYGKFAGVMRIVSGPGHCSRFENPISWNSEGAAGGLDPNRVYTKVCQSTYVCECDNPGDELITGGLACPQIGDDFSGTTFLYMVRVSTPLPDANGWYGDCFTYHTYSLSGYAPGYLLINYQNGIQPDTITIKCYEP